MAAPKATETSESRANPSKSGNELSPVQTRAIVALLSAKSIKQAAKRLQVNESSIRRWLREDKAFIKAFRAARRQYADVALGRIEKAMGEAVNALIGNLKCDNPTVVNVAAKTLLEFGVKGGELNDIKEQLEEALQAIGLKD